MDVNAMVTQKYEEALKAIERLDAEVVFLRNELGHVREECFSLRLEREQLRQDNARLIGMIDGVKLIRGTADSE